MAFTKGTPWELMDQERACLICCTITLILFCSTLTLTNCTRTACRSYRMSPAPRRSGAPVAWAHGNGQSVLGKKQQAWAVLLLQRCKKGLNMKPEQCSLLQGHGKGEGSNPWHTRSLPHSRPLTRLLCTMVASHHQDA
eukprot:155510-Pelagomonas_calceolata.AAC.1